MQANMLMFILMATRWQHTYPASLAPRQTDLFCKLVDAASEVFADPVHSHCLAVQLRQQICHVRHQPEHVVHCHTKC